MSDYYPLPTDFMATCGVFRLFVPMEGTDATERGLLEGRSLLHPPHPSDYAACPYPGRRSRAGLLMNIGGLRHFLRHRDASLAHLSALSGATTCGGEDGPLSETVRLLRVAHAAYHAPKAWLLAAPRRLAVPPCVAAAAKVGHGVYELGLHMAQRHGIHASPGIDAFIDEAEASGRLVGRREVCAGSERRIREVLEVVLNDGRPTAAASRLVSLGALLWKAEALALATAYLGLARVARGATAGGRRDAVLAEARITFPNALTPLECVIEDRPAIGSFATAYFADIPVHRPVAAAVQPAQWLLRTFRDQLARAPHAVDTLPAESDVAAAVAALDGAMTALGGFAPVGHSTDENLVRIVLGPFPLPSQVEDQAEGRADPRTAIHGNRQEANA